MRYFTVHYYTNSGKSLCYQQFSDPFLLSNMMHLDQFIGTLILLGYNANRKSYSSDTISHGSVLKQKHIKWNDCFYLKQYECMV